VSIKFVDRENQDIKNLVQIAWEHLEDHRNEVLLVPERTEKFHELINDSEKATPRTQSDHESDLKLERLNQVSRMGRPKRLHPPPIIAVDAGVVNLGSLVKGGTVFAVRGSACCYMSEGNVIILRYNTGAIPIDQQNKLKVLHAMGKRLGEPEFFVKEIDEYPYLQEKSGVIETTDQLQDRFRNFVERIIQAEAIGILKKYNGGILLIDGALPDRSYDTPKNYLLNQSKKLGMLYEADQNSIDVVAISKKTRITVEGIPIQKLLTEKYGSDFIGFLSLKDVVNQERKETRSKQSGTKPRLRVTMAKEMYAARFGFGPLSLTFRVDVHNCKGKRASEVINDVYNYCRIYGGYPKPLIEAHQNSCFLFQDFQNLLADVAVRLGVKPEEQPSMEVLFQPFGSFGK